MLQKLQKQRTSAHNTSVIVSVESEKAIQDRVQNRDSRLQDDALVSQHGLYNPLFEIRNSQIASSRLESYRLPSDNFSNNLGSP